MLTESLVLSVLNFGDIVYGPRLFVKTERAIQRVQNSCARFCFHIPKRAHVTPFLNEKGILKMKERRLLHLSSLVHRVVYSKRPMYLFTKFVWRNDIHGTNTRRGHLNLMASPWSNTVGFRGTFKFAAAKVWNDLPPPLRQYMPPITFKKTLKKVLLNKQLNNLT